MKFFPTGILLILLFACKESDQPSQHAASKCVSMFQAGKKSYPKNAFVEITHNQLDEDIMSEMNHSSAEVGVFKGKEGVVFKRPKWRYHYFFEWNDGKIEVWNRGEFGGEVNFIHPGLLMDTVVISNLNVVSVFRFKGEIYLLSGLLHMQDHGGAIHKFIQEGSTFRLKKIVELQSAPAAMTIYKDQLLIACHENFTLLKDWKKAWEISNTMWSSLYPNSVAAINDEEVYVGYRGGYAKISLNDRSLIYYRLKSKAGK